MEINEVEGWVVRSVNEILETLCLQIDGSVTLDTTLFGPNGILRSMDLVVLIVDLEEKIESEYGISLILADDKAMSQQKSPFRTVSSLSRYICMLMGEMKGPMCARRVQSE